MTVDEAIQKFWIKAGERDGIRGIVINYGKPTAKEIAWLRENKLVILAELDDREAAQKAKEQQEVNAILAGDRMIRAQYQDGEYLSGWSVYGKEAKLLEKIGLAKPVSGWGYLVDAKAIKALGEEFSYLAAVEYMRPAKEAAEAKKAQSEAERQAKFDEARASDEPVILRMWTTDCNDPEEECNTDIVIEFAMPDGSIDRQRIHTY